MFKVALLDEIVHQAIELREDLAVADDAPEPPTMRDGAAIASKRLWS
jgi:hypothetical protein